MNVFQESCCSTLAVLLLFLLQGSRADDPGVHVHKAVGDSLDLIANYTKENLEVKWKYNWTDFAEYDKDQIKLLEPPLFHKRLKMNKDNISVTVEDLKLQDSGIFTIVAEIKSVQIPTETIVLHVHDLIRDVQIELNHSWMESKNICVFHLRCQASGDPNPSYSWSGDSVTTGPNLSINVTLTKRATLNCTANNTVSTKSTIKTAECRGKPEDSSFLKKYLLIAAGVGIVVFVIFGGSAALCCWRRKRTGEGESEAGITVYEDVNTKRSEIAVNGMSIYETVDDIKVTKSDLPQTLYDKINYQRHPAVSASTPTPSPYQEVL